MSQQNYLALLAVAVRHLGWTPATFWQATPRELAAALEPPVAGAGMSPPLTREELTALARRFPDRAPLPTRHPPA